MSLNRPNALLKSLLMVSTLVSVSTAFARGELTESVTWHDGDRVRRAWLNPGLVAQFGDGQAEREIKARFPEAKRHVVKHGRSRGLKVWKVASGSQRSRLREINKAAIPGQELRISEVFHDRPSSNSAMRALPGGVVIQLPGDWSEARCTEWIRSQGHDVVRSLGSLRNGFLISSDPGLPTIEAANRLHETGVPLTATPDWSVEVSTR